MEEEHHSDDDHMDVDHSDEEDSDGEDSEDEEDSREADSDEEDGGNGWVIHHMFEEEFHSFIHYDDPELQIERMSVGDIHELANKSFSDQKSLLKSLRKVKPVYGGETDEEAEQLMDLILKHASWFPLKLRAAIAAAKAESEALDDTSEKTPAMYFYREVCGLLAHFLCGDPLEANFGEGEIENMTVDDGVWHGPDIRVDTKDQIELAIRLCPDVFRLLRKLDDGTPPQMTFFIESVEWLPFIIDLHPQYPAGFHIPTFFVTLLNNYDYQSDRLDEVSFRVLQHLVDKHDVTSADLKLIITQFLYETVDTRSFGFIERRIRFLIGCDPTLLALGSAKYSYSYLIAAFCDVNDKRKDKPPLDIRLYKLAMELGILYFPHEVLGFVLQEMNFGHACNVFGVKPVKQAINDKIAGLLAQHEIKNKNKNLLMDWILEAADDWSIGLDGFHTLVRFDPIVLAMNRGTK